MASKEREGKEKKGEYNERMKRNPLLSVGNR